MMVKLLIYGYATGVFSSRGIARKLAEDAHFGEALREDELPEELRWREDRLAATRAAKARMAEKLSTETGRAHYAQRKWLSEAPNGWIEEVLGFRRFSLRGLNKVRGEWDLICLPLNVKRMQGLQPV